MERVSFTTMPANRGRSTRSHDTSNGVSCLPQLVIEGTQDDANLFVQLVTTASANTEYKGRLR